MEEEDAVLADYIEASQAVGCASADQVAYLLHLSMEIPGEQLFEVVENHRHHRWEEAALES